MWPYLLHHSGALHHASTDASAAAHQPPAPTKLGRPEPGSHSGSGAGRGHGHGHGHQGAPSLNPHAMDLSPDPHLMAPSSHAGHGHGHGHGQGQGHDHPGHEAMHGGVHGGGHGGVHGGHANRAVASPLGPSPLRGHGQGQGEGQGQGAAPLVAAPASPVKGVKEMKEVPHAPKGHFKEHKGYVNSSASHSKHQRKGAPGVLMCDGKRLDSEVIYWRRVPGDDGYESPITPHHDEHHDKYITFQYDQGGWNNIRMGMEIVIVVAHAMGRTLVIPPEQRLYLLGKAHHDPTTNKKVNAPKYGFESFFDVALLRSHHGLHTLSMEQFLAKEGVSGHLHGKLPPGNSTIVEANKLWGYLSSVGDVKPAWSGQFLAMPATAADVMREHDAGPPPSGMGKNKSPNNKDGDGGNNGGGKAEALIGFDGPGVSDRLTAFRGARKAVHYDKTLQDAKLIHFEAGQKTRLLQHHYAFTFFADPTMQSFYRRFIRDYMRYQDVIQCAGHELVAAVREDARAHHGGEHGDYYALHVRRGDFQFKEVKISAADIVKTLNGEGKDGGDVIIPPGSIVYVSTDDPKGTCDRCMANKKLCVAGPGARGITGCIEDPSWKAFTDAGWEIRFLDDFLNRGVLKGANPNFYGMVESIVCSRAKAFAGTYFSTFTGYIHRLRGYHGLGEQTYYHSPGRRDAARMTKSVGHGFAREWRAGWTDDEGELI